MANKVNIIEASKKNWAASSENENGYPGDMNIQIACFQRIAAATEAMAVNHVRLQEDYGYMRGERDKYRLWYENQLASNRALRGVITKLKNKLTQVK